MSSFTPPIYKSDIFDSGLFNTGEDTLTFDSADARYLKLSGGTVKGATSFLGGLNTNSLSINGVLADLTYITGITTGTSSPNKALVVDSGRNITGIQGICLGTSTDTSRYLSLLVSSTAGTTLYGLTYGVDNSTNNQSEFAFYYAGSGSTSNALSFGFYTNSNILRINADQSVDVPFHNGTTGLKLGGMLITATAAEINYVDVTTAGTAQASKALILNSSKAIYDIGELSFSASGVNKVVLKKSTTGQGLYLYDTQTSTSPAATISILCANQSSPNFIEFDSAFTPDSFTISHKDGSAFTSGFRISSTNTTQASNVNANVMLAARNGTIPHVVVNDSQNQLHLFPQGLAELNTSYVQNVIIGEELLIRKNLQIGTSQDNASTKLISALDSTQATGTKRYITLGKNNVSNSQAEIYFHYDSSASDSSYLGFGHFGKSDVLTVGANGWVGINTNSPLAPLHVNMTASVAYGVPFNTLYRLRTDNGVTESATGPISYNTSAVFNGYIACTAMAMSSDKRLKENIKDVSFERVDNFYRTMTPKKYNFKNNKTKIEYGFVAQDVVKAGYLDLISMIGNEDLKGVIEEPEVDLDGIQLCIDYQKITMFNTVMIQSLLKKVETQQTELQELRSLVETLTSKPALAKWLSKNM